MTNDQIEHNLKIIKQVFNYYLNFNALKSISSINKILKTTDEENELFLPTFSSCTTNFLINSDYEMYIVGGDDVGSMHNKTVLFMKDDMLLFYVNNVRYSNRYSKLTSSMLEINGNSIDNNIYLYEKNNEKNGMITLPDDVDEGWWFQNDIRVDLPLYENGLVFKQYHKNLSTFVQSITIHEDEWSPYVYAKPNIIISTTLCEHCISTDNIEIIPEVQYMLDQYKKGL